MKKCPEHLFLTLWNHFENQPSTILNFLEHLQLYHINRESHMEIPLVWIIAKTLSTTWTQRQEGPSMRGQNKSVVRGQMLFAKGE